MPPYLFVVAEVAHHFALLPVLWVAILTYYGHRPALEWWALAATLEMFWMADTAAHHMDPWVVSALYPMGQTALLAIFLLPPIAALRLIGLVLSVGVGMIALRGIAKPDLVAHTAAWVSILLIVWPIQTTFARAVFTIFGLCWVSWALFSMLPTLASWSFFQTERIGAAIVFCWGSLHSVPVLRRAAFA